MATFAELDDLFDAAIELPLRGADGRTRTYRVEPPPADLGLWLERMLSAGVALRNASTEDQMDAIATQMRGTKPPGNHPEDVSIHQLVLGKAWDAMVTDGVAWQHVQHAGTTAYLYATVGEEAAVAWWESAGRPEAQAANRAARRQTSKRTAGANVTRARGSTSGTNSRTISNPAGRRNRSAGQTS